MHLEIVDQDLKTRFDFREGVIGFEEIKVRAVFVPNMVSNVFDNMKQSPDAVIRAQISPGTIADLPVVREFGREHPEALRKHR